MPGERLLPDGPGEAKEALVRQQHQASETQSYTGARTLRPHPTQRPPRTHPPGQVSGGRQTLRTQPRCRRLSAAPVGHSVVRARGRPPGHSIRSRYGPGQDALRKPSVAVDHRPVAGCAGSSRPPDTAGCLLPVIDRD